MISGFVEVSQESLALAEAEVISAVEAVGGGAVRPARSIPGLVEVEVPGPRAWGTLADRLALARRCLVLVEPSADPEEAARLRGRRGGSAAFRRLGEPSGGGDDAAVLACGRAFKAGGGSIDLESPASRFWIVRGDDGSDRLLEQVASVDRRGPALRRMPLLPFRRPVSLPPRLARAAVNLAQVNPKERVLDPFLGTGALLAEAGLLGARLYGVDRDPTMIRGALQNLDYLGVSAEELIVGDARSVDFSDPAAVFSAIVTDPPYGRSSSTGGEASAGLVAEVLERWWERLLPDGRLLVIVPAGDAELAFFGTPRFRIPVRVHRSLTREFFLFEKREVSRN